MSQCSWNQCCEHSWDQGKHSHRGTRRQVLGREVHGLHSSADQDSKSTRFRRRWEFTQETKGSMAEVSPMTRTQMAQPVGAELRFPLRSFRPRRTFLWHHIKHLKEVCVYPALPNLSHSPRWLTNTPTHIPSMSIIPTSVWLYSSDIRKSVIYLFLITKNNQSFIPSSRCIKGLRQLSELCTRKQDHK